MLNNTPLGNRIHIGIFGRRNAGKSSIINGLTGQNIAIVSKVKGTTTDPVSKAMELLPLGPVVLIDTPGIDDRGDLGALRVKKSYQVLNTTDIAVVVIDALMGIGIEEVAVIKKIKEKDIPCVMVINKEDLVDEATLENIKKSIQTMVGIFPIVVVSADTKMGIEGLKALIAQQLTDRTPKFPVVSDLIEPSDFVVLVIPIDEAAPKGRLILPQQQTIRDILDAGGITVVVSVEELPFTLKSLGKKPRLVITDSQVFKQVAKHIPEDIFLTSFSILFARHKGRLKPLLEGIDALQRLKDGDRVLIAEGCTHHRQCGDIGTEKIPEWLMKYTQLQLDFSFVSGTQFPEDLSDYQLVIHCGGCMLNEKAMGYRMDCAKDSGVQITNYGMLIAHINGVLERSTTIFIR